MVVMCGHRANSLLGVCAPKVRGSVESDYWAMIIETECARCVARVRWRQASVGLVLFATSNRLRFDLNQSKQ